MTLPRSDDLGTIVRPTEEERANVRANLARYARDADDLAFLIAVIEDDR